MSDVRRLPTPVTEIWDWQMRGACRGMDIESFFHPERERGPARAIREARAKAVCRGCPVLEQCRDHALAVHEPYGVWGGLSVAERDELLRADSTHSVVTEVDFAHWHRGRPRLPGARAVSPGSGTPGHARSSRSPGPRPG